VAGKVTGPGNGPVDSPGTPIGGPDEGRPVEGGRAPFAEKLKPADQAGAAGAPAAAAPPASGVADLAAALKAGTLSPQAAVDRVIDRVVDKQLGAHAPAAAREKLRAALETAVADDPLLAEKIRGLA
jgi:hypothetical protein